MKNNKFKISVLQAYGRSRYGVFVNQPCYLVLRYKLFSELEFMSGSFPGKEKAESSCCEEFFQKQK